MDQSDWEARHVVRLDGTTGSFDAYAGEISNQDVEGIVSADVTAEVDGERIARRVPYVHKQVPRHTQDAIDDLAQSDLPSSGYTHDSNVSVRGGNLSGRGYRRSRNGMSRFQENNRYGQYLEMPKGQRSIFASREQMRRRRSVIALIAVIIALAVVAFIVWRAMSDL